MQPPLTPMIDVTFQLLLFFLLTMTFRLPEGMIPGALPQQGTSSASEAITEPIKVFIYPRNANRDAYYEIEGYGQEIDNAKDLYDVFMGRIEALGTREGPVVITPQARVRWQYVTEVFNQANRAQFENIGFAPAAS
jgi:biopolymer transport protein ExbD